MIKYNCEIILIYFTILTLWFHDKKIVIPLKCFFRMTKGYIEAIDDNNELTIIERFGNNANCYTLNKGGLNLLTFFFSCQFTSSVWKRQRPHNLLPFISRRYNYDCYSFSSFVLKYYQVATTPALEQKPEGVQVALFFVLYFADPSKTWPPWHSAWWRGRAATESKNTSFSQATSQRTPLMVFRLKRINESWFNIHKWKLFFYIFHRTPSRFSGVHYKTIIYSSSIMKCT